jgi:hypothetical protein
MEGSMTVHSNRPLAFLTVLVGLVTLTLVAPHPLRSAFEVALDHRLPLAGDVYSVRALHIRLAHDRAAWIGKAVRVRGIADYCLSWVSLYGGDAQNVCTAHQTVLRDASSTGSTDKLPLRFAPEDRLLASLRHISVIAASLPVAQVPWWGVPQTYMVRLDLVPSDVCWNATPCIAAILLDADRTAL